MLNDAQADNVRAKVAADARVQSALESKPAAGAPMSPRVATFAAAYLLGVADGSASEHELGWLHHFLGKLDALHGTAALTEADLEKVSTNIIVSRRKPEAFIASIAASLPDKTHRAGALYLACIVAFLDGKVYDSEDKVIDQLATGLGMHVQEKLTVMETARDLVISLGR